jgi:urea ABC transporter ATP-binding protein UrtE
MLLQVDGLSSGYGQSQVVHSVSLDIGPSEAICLLGRNGVGKTTLVKTIMGLLRATSGTVMFDGRDLTNAPTHRIARAGIGYVPQGRDVFGALTVEENLVVALGRRTAVPPDILDLFPVLGRRLRQKAGTLSGGEQQQLAIARALVTEPKLLILDEPSEGIQRSIILEIRALLHRLRDELGLSVLIIEQDLEFALDVGERGYVLEKGHIVTSGTRQELRHADVVEVYLAV